LTNCSNDSHQLESAIELPWSLQAQHAISILESKISSLESLVQQSQASPLPAAEPAPPHADSLTKMLNWEKIVEGQWSSIREEWESKVKSAEPNLSMTATKFDAGLTGLAV
jgi:hypothetical protein